ncbi:MAG: hypothetical protein R3C62_20335 [Chloroflexota bacterium]
MTDDGRPTTDDGMNDGKRPFLPPSHNSKPGFTAVFDNQPPTTDDGMNDGKRPFPPNTFCTVR